MHDEMEALKSLLKKEINKVTAKGDLTPVELENMTKALCLLEQIEDYEEYKDGESSYRMSRTSHRRGRSPSTGRYVSMDYYDMPEEPYSHRTNRMRPMRDFYEKGYSGHSIHDRMVAKLEEMYDEAKTDHERQIVDKWIERLEHETN